MINYSYSRLQVITETSNVAETGSWGDPQSPTRRMDTAQKRRRRSNKHFYEFGILLYFLEKLKLINNVKKFFKKLG